jgi:hypothetical protein
MLAAVVIEMPALVLIHVIELIEMLHVMLAPLRAIEPAIELGLIVSPVTPAGVHEPLELTPVNVSDQLVALAKVMFA